MSASTSQTTPMNEELGNIIPNFDFSSITTVISLIAFLFAVYLSYKVIKLKQRTKRIELSAEEDRSQLVEKEIQELNTLRKLNTDNLNKEQKVMLILTEMKSIARQRLLIISGVVIGVALILFSPNVKAYVDHYFGNATGKTECNDECKSLLGSINSDYKTYEIKVTTVSDSMVEWRNQLPWNEITRSQWARAYNTYNSLRDSIEVMREIRKQQLSQFDISESIVSMFENLDQRAMEKTHRKVRSGLDNISQCYKDVFPLDESSEKGMNERNICAQKIIDWKTELNEDLVELNLSLNHFQNEISPYILN